ncbi:sigma-70 family RNA polymerase sigma factor [bacterium]|nr:sigma-70 family RNA polymerase sigma factor [bacterium]
MHDAREQLERRFSELYPPLYRYVASRVPHRPDAEDIVSQTWMQALERARLFDAARGTVEQWVFGIAKNRIKMHWRARRVTVSVDDVEHLLATSSDATADVDRTLLLEKIFATLNAEQKALLTLRYVDGLSFDEIASKAESTAPTMRKRLSRLLPELRGLFTNLVD